MNHFLLNLLGFDVGRIPEGADYQFKLTNAPTSWLATLMVAVVAALIYGVIYLYRRELDTCPRWARIMLAAVRTAVLLVLAFVLLGPALAITQKRTIEPYVVLLLDDSQSLSIPDRYLDESAVAPIAAATGRTAEEIRSEAPTRAKLIDEVFNRDDAAAVRKLAARGRLKVMTFSNKTTDVDLFRRSAAEKSAPEKSSAEKTDAKKPAEGTRTPPAPNKASLIALAAAVDKPAEKSNNRSSDQSTGDAEVSYKLPPLQPNGAGTHIAKAIREALKKLSGNPVAGVVLVTDGQDTAKDDDPLAAAELARSQSAPIFTVGVGDPQKPRNIRLADVYADEQVWRADPFEIQATLQSQGFDKTEVEVELVEQPLDAGGSAVGQPTIIQRRKVTLDGSGQQNLSFKHAQKKDGPYSYSVAVPVQPGELLDTDNQKSVRVKVLKEQARVLLIAGGPTWEYRLVSGLFTRDPTIDLSCWLQSMDPEMQQEGKTPIVKLPFTLEELGKYDLVMMFDPDPDEFNEAWFSTLKTFVGERAGGLLYLAGPKFSSRLLSDNKAKPLVNLLPVSMADATTMESESFSAKANREWPLGIVAANLDHPVMRFDIDMANNQARWSKLPGVFWSFPVADVKPTTRVLIEHSNPELRRASGPRPLLVTGQYGAGRTAFMGFNGTWRWRRVGKDAEFFNKFWVQMSRFLVEGKLLSSKRRGTIETTGEKFHVGDQVIITARLTDAGFQPLTDKKISATVHGPKGNELPVELKATPNQPGQFNGSITAATLGLNEISLSLAGDKPEDTVRIAKAFDVELPRVEFDDTRLNKTLLKELAERSGGQYFDLDRVSEIAAAIPDRQQTIAVAGKPAELWDTNRLLMLLVGLLTVEWAFRKKFKLM